MKPMLYLFHLLLYSRNGCGRHNTFFTMKACVDVFGRRRERQGGMEVENDIERERERCLGAAEKVTRERY